MANLNIADNVTIISKETNQSVMIDLRVGLLRTGDIESQSTLWIGTEAYNFNTIDELVDYVSFLAEQFKSHDNLLMKKVLKSVYGSNK